MKCAPIPALLAALLLGACSWIPRAGPMAGEVADQQAVAGEVLFDVVNVDDHVLATLLAQPRESLAARFKKYREPPDLRIAIGDTISLTIWESATGGVLGAGTGAPAKTSPALGLQPGAPSAGSTGVSAETVPGLQVGPDGAISVPYAGRIRAAGRSPAQLQQAIEEGLAGKAILPQVLVIVDRSVANTVTAAGEMLNGARIRLTPDGDRLLQVIAAAGGAKAPIRDVFVRLSRGGVTATIPLETLVSDPAENIYAEPGDVLTLVEQPQTYSIFGAAGTNAAITFKSDRLSLTEALAGAKGLNDNRANPTGVFLFRYEPDSVVRAFGQPLAAGAPRGISPVVYRFDLGDAKTNFLAREFPVRDKDVIFVADAPTEQVRKVFEVIGEVVGPFRTSLLICRRAKC